MSRKMLNETADSRRITSIMRPAAFHVLGLLACGFPLSASPLKLVYPGTTNPAAAISIPDGRGGQYTYSGKHVHSVDYQVNNAPWVVNLSPDPPVYFAPGDISDEGFYAEFSLQQLLGSAFTGLTFADAAQPLSDDSLNIHTYAAIHGTGPNVCADGKCVGADFAAIYTPHGTDPTDVHWIQIVSSDGGAPRLDNAGSKGRSPYYDDHGSANAQGFLDSPRRDDAHAHTWWAVTYLVTGPAVPASGNITGQITVLAGIFWGWENHCTQVSPSPRSQSQESTGASCPCSCDQTTADAPEAPGFLYAGLGLSLLGLAGKAKRLLSLT